MRDLKKLEFLFKLKDVIVKKHYDCELSSDESNFYDMMCRNISEENEPSIDDSLLFEEYFTYLFYDWYYSDESNQDNSIEEVEDLLIFRGLLHFKGKNVSLNELYDFIFGKFYKDKYDISTIDGRNKFLEKLNGCLGEARVGKVDGSSFVPRELIISGDKYDLLIDMMDGGCDTTVCSGLNIKESTMNNPLLFITGLEPTKVLELSVEDGKRFTLVSISDLHLGSRLIDNNGNLDESTLRERLEFFTTFKNQLIADLKNNNINVDGIVFVGDTLDGLCGVYNVDDNNRDTLSFNLNRARNKIFEIISEYNLSHDECLKISSDCGVVGFIVGNHDNTFGKKLFLDIMKEFSDSAVLLGNGSGRIKVNNEYIMFSHPNALDWGLPIVDNLYKIRRGLNNDIFHFDEYFDLCKKKYELLDRCNLVSELGITPALQLANLVDLVNEDLKKNNPELYKFYEPFITRGNGDGTECNKSCFEQAMMIETLDDGTMVLEKINKVKHGFGIDRFIHYGKKNKNIKQMLEERNVCLVGDYLDPVLSIIGHFHTRLNNGKKVTYAKEDIVCSNDGLLPVVVEEGSTFVNSSNGNISYSSTICCLDIKDGVIDKIEFEPAVYIVNRDELGCHATRMIGTQSSVYVRKKTL